MKYNKKQGTRYCSQCRSKLYKNGFECGKQRWRCLQCGTAKILKRSDVTLRNSKPTYQKYLLKKNSISDIAESKNVSRWTVSRRFNQDMRDIKPVITGEIYSYIIIDAKVFGDEVVAIVRDKDYIRNWRFGIIENSHLWIATLNDLPCPGGVVCDGQKGILKAIHNVWGDIPIQRCQFHIKMNLRVKLTRNPESEAGKDLAWITKFMCEVKNEEQMTQFVAIFYHYYEIHKTFINERTYNKNPKIKRVWWYTHGNVRSAYRQIANLIEQDQLFAYITHSELNLPNTTNKLEGGINNTIDELIRAHRGMNMRHQERLIAEFLLNKSEHQ